MIRVIAQDISVSDIEEKTITDAIKTVLSERKYDVTVNLCSDSFILEQNIKSLGHNYFTDIITYYYDSENPINEADLLISVDRVRENAETESVSFLQELARVAIHGCLHLLGFEDETDEEKSIMRIEENKYLHKLFHVEP